MAQEQPEQTDGLTPMGVQRLRELRAENNELRAQLAALEKEQTQSISRAPPESGTDPPPQDGRRRRKLQKVLSNALFVLALALTLVAAVFIRATRQGAPTTIAGYSGMLVLTESMQDVIPKGSLIITKTVEPHELQIGDDITFMVNPTTSVTHRIVDIRPQANGVPIIQTKGVNNSTPDTPVPVENIVGKVVYHSLFLGLLAKGVSDNWPLLLFLLAVWAALGKVLVRVFREDSQTNTQDSPQSGQEVQKQGDVML